MADEIQAGISYMQKMVLSVATGALTIGLVSLIALTITTANVANNTAVRLDGKLDNISEQIGDIKKTLPNYVTQQQFQSAKDLRDLQMDNLLKSIAFNSQRIDAISSRISHN